MCGIAGIVSERSAWREDALGKMLSAMAHRGPDDTQRVTVGKVAIGTARLALLDLSECGRQPMGDARTGWLAFNGEVFNHDELRSQLVDVEYAGASDTETLLHILRAGGPTALMRVAGFFAVAMLTGDGRRLLLARDALGVKPLYIARYGEAVLFASEVRALLAAGVRRRARVDVLEHCLRTRWSNGAQTPLEGIQRVLPGTFLTIETVTGDIDERQWQCDDFLIDHGLRCAMMTAGRVAGADLLDERIGSAVRQRLRCDAPVGVLCSGGLDSSLILSLAARVQRGIPAYVARFEDQPEYDESSWAAMACRHANAECRPVSISAPRWRRAFVRGVVHFEYPLVHESAIALSLIAREARNDGLKAVLGGEGADELFGGYPSRHQTIRNAFLRLPDNSRQAQRTGLRSVDGVPTEVSSYEAFVLQRIESWYSHAPDVRRDLEVALASELFFFLPHGLNRLDKNLMQSSIEYREPFLDPAVVRFGLSIPLEWRVTPRLKGVLLDVAARHLPPAIIDRPKVGFSADVGAYLEGSVDPEFLLDGLLRSELRAGREWEARVQSASRHERFRLYSAEIWCRAFLDDQSVASIEGAMWLPNAELSD